MSTEAELLQRRMTRSQASGLPTHRTPHLPSSKLSPNNHAHNGTGGGGPAAQPTPVFMANYPGTKSSAQGQSRPLRHSTVGDTPKWASLTGPHPTSYGLKEGSPEILLKVFRALPYFLVVS